MFKNKRWLRELYLVYGSRLHVNVLIGQLLYLRYRVSPSLEGMHGGGVQKGPPVCLAQDSWVATFSPVEFVIFSLGTIAKQDNWYLKIHRKSILSQRHNCYDSEK